MLQITYISTAAPNTTEAEVNRILLSSRSNNGRLNLSGLLLFDGVRFLQHLEGEAANVERIYERIRADRRHRAVVELSRRTTTGRQFPKWWMAYERARGAAPDHAALFQQVAMLVSGCDRSTAAHFLGFAKLRSGRAA